MQVRLAPEVRRESGRLGQVLVGREDRVRVPLAQVAHVADEVGPVQVSREGGRRKLTVEANLRGRDVAGFVAEAKARVDRDVDLPPGYSLAWGGSFKNLQAATEATPPMLSSA